MDAMFKSHWFLISKTDWSKLKVLKAFKSYDYDHLQISSKNSCIFLSNASKKTHRKTPSNIENARNHLGLPSSHPIYPSIPSPRVNSVLPNSVPKWSKPQLRNQRTRPRTCAVFPRKKLNLEIFRVGDFHWMWFWCDFFDIFVVPVT